MDWVWASGSVEQFLRPMQGDFGPSRMRDWAPGFNSLFRLKEGVIMDTKPVVYVVDDDPSVRNAITMLLEASGFKVETSDSAQAFLKRDLVDASGCLVLDVQMEGLSGLDLQQELTAADVHLPIIFITGH